MATPRTVDFFPKVFQNPAFVQAVSRLSFRETGPWEAKEYTENTFRTPDGNCTTAVWELKSSLINLAVLPELRTYLTPAPGNNSKSDTLDSRAI